MSGIVVVAPVLALVLCFCVWQVCQFGAARYEWTRRTMGVSFAIVVVMFPVSCTSIMFTLPAAMRRIGHGVSGEDANRHLRFTNVPDVANNVSYRHDYFSGLTEAAEFSCSIEEFLKWADENGWQPERFESPADVKASWKLATRWTRHIDGQIVEHGKIQTDWFLTVFGDYNSTLTVTRGYYYDTYADEGVDDSGLAVLYDSDRERCYMTFTTF